MSDFLKEHFKELLLCCHTMKVESSKMDFKEMLNKNCAYESYIIFQVFLNHIVVLFQKQTRI